MKKFLLGTQELRKKILHAFLISSFILSARSATIVGDMRPVLGTDATNTPITLSSPDLPQNYNGKTYFAVTTSSQLTNGQLNVTLDPPGRWNISFFGKNTSLRIINPANTNTYDISQMLTNVLVFANQGISKYVLPGSGFAIVTNNAGLANESITISSFGGVASNAFQTEVSGAGLSLSTDALNFLYTLSLNAHLQGWSAIDPVSKQDHSANLDSWSGLTIDNTTIIETGGVLSAVGSGGSGTVSSVGLTGPSEFDYGAAITTSGNLSFSRHAGATANYAGQTGTNWANLISTNSMGVVAAGSVVDATNVLQLDTVAGTRMANINTNGDGWLRGNYSILGNIIGGGTAAFSSDITSGGTVQGVSVKVTSATANTVPLLDSGKNVVSLANPSSAGTWMLSSDGSGNKSWVLSLDGSTLSANHHIGTGPTTNLVNQEDFTGYINSVSITNYNAGTNIVATFDGNLHSGVITNGPDVFITFAVAGNAAGSWSWRIVTNCLIHLPAYDIPFLAGSNATAAHIFSYTNGVLSLTSYGSTNGNRMEAAAKEN